MVADWSDDDIWHLRRGGHDYAKLYAAYAAARAHKGRPTVVLAKTVKGFTLGSHFEARNATHQMKKLTLDDLKELRDTLDIPSRTPRWTPICRRTTTPAHSPRRSSTRCSGATSWAASYLRGASRRDRCANPTTRPTRS